DRLPEGFIPIGDDSNGNQICLGIKEPHYDHIYIWDHEDEQDEPDMSNMYFVANDIWEFLDSLYDDADTDNKGLNSSYDKRILKGQQHRVLVKSGIVNVEKL